MIAELRGQLLVKSPTYVVVDIGGVGYRVFIPLSTFYRLPDPPREVRFFTTTHVREDAIHLYGFLTRKEQQVFELLRGVSGIGPRLATNILSGIAVEDLIPAIAGGDLARLSTIPGVGRKTAERIVLELKEKIDEAFAPSVTTPTPPVAVDGMLRDVISALVNLGYGRAVAIRAAEAAGRDVPSGGEATVEGLIKEALRGLVERTG
ncbi:MAG: Holliday junction branch migration protein RuvA [Candidatus Methylomirabilales bacterium]